jgi:hypothetical protein
MRTAGCRPFRRHCRSCARVLLALPRGHKAKKELALVASREMGVGVGTVLRLTGET